MDIELRLIADIRPYDNNPRQNDAAVDAVAASIREFGFRQPIVVDAEGVIICGHTRYKAAQKLGLEKVPVHVAKDLTPEQIKAYRIADNKTAELADWDYELLPIELAELQGMDFDLGLLGFAEDELAKIFDPGVKDGLTDPDEVPEPPDEAITQPGDLWILGDHRLLCGDSSKPEDVDRLLGGDEDPAGQHRSAVQREGRAAQQQRHRRRATVRSPTTITSKLDLARHPEKAKPTHKKMRAKDRPLANDFVSDEEFDAMLHAWFGNMARVLEPGRWFYIWGGYANCGNYPPVLKASKTLLLPRRSSGTRSIRCSRARTSWARMSGVSMAGGKALAIKFFGPNNATDVWHVKKINPNKMVHLTEKPVELAVRAMQYSSRAGENVLDLFGGSGSTLIAAEQTGRKAFLMELDAPYAM